MVTPRTILPYESSEAPDPVVARGPRLGVASLALAVLSPVMLVGAAVAQTVFSGGYRMAFWAVVLTLAVAMEAAALAAGVVAFWTIRPSAGRNQGLGLACATFGIFISLSAFLMGVAFRLLYP